MAFLYSLSLLTSMLLLTACTAGHRTGNTPTTGFSTARLSAARDHTPPTDATVNPSPPITAYTAFGNKPAPWRAVVDGPLLQVERSPTDLVTLTAERIDHARGVTFTAIKRMAGSRNKRSMHNVNLNINATSCANGTRTYHFNALLRYDNKTYSGCAVAGAMATND